MGRHSVELKSSSAAAIAAIAEGNSFTRRPLRRRYTLPVSSFVAALGFVFVSIVDPYSGAYATESAAPVVAPAPPQHIDIAGEFSNSVAVGAYGVTEAPEPEPVVVVTPEIETESDDSSSSSEESTSKKSSSAPVSGKPDPGTAKAIAYDMVLARGWSSDQYDCLVSLWNKESSWNVYAQNKSSGAYGIPQALPGSKMASAGSDWQTNPATQISWGLGYISGRYGTPCGAWGHSQSVGWY
ncbi:aggregation-promoting factor C-terminal-like domain-containing protein [Herbiconiux sp. SYSU D00978]|uniref:aggregation-promoting factor C-terminal-like domain-containing protein n=1 Tax=Herbiconiux sp. SYSU D00978 TaxID=2812562 RepID=UPI0027DD6090|nr:lytic transglycosylase domain-containing protein [Herbiconiux sp. SYSU D00978]